MYKWKLNSFSSKLQYIYHKNANNNKRLPLKLFTCELRYKDSAN